MQFHHCSPHLFKRGMLPFITTFDMLPDNIKGTLCLGKEATIVKQGSGLLQAHSTDPGHGFPQCLFWYV
jgi:hypothetical protein